MRSIAAALSLIGAIQSGAALAAEPERLAPNSQWLVHEEDESCIMRRGFGPPDRAVVLHLSQYVPGDGFDVIVTSKVVAAGRDTPEARFEPDADFRPAPDASRLNVEGDFHGAVYRASLMPGAAPAPGKPPAKWSAQERAAREKAVTGYTIRNVFDRELTLATGELHKPMEVMRTCLNEMLKFWGLDPAVQNSLSRKVQPSNYPMWVKNFQTAYPFRRLDKARSGRVRVRFMIDERGAVRSCHVQFGDRDKAFEQAACQDMIERGRFDPARDASGKPVASYFIQPLVYQTRR